MRGGVIYRPEKSPRNPGVQTDMSTGSDKYTPRGDQPSGEKSWRAVAIIVVVLTEMIGDSIGLGYYITIWSTRFRFANVYAAIIVIGICGLVLDQALLALRHRLVYWQREKR